MKKTNLIIAALLLVMAFTAGSVKAQDVKGKNFVNAGIGVGTFGFSGTGGVPVTLSLEHGFTDKISGGLYFGIIQRKYFDDFKYNYKVIGVRASYHFNEALNISNPKVDVYGGASLYYRGYTVKWEDSDGAQKTSASTVGIALHAAGRYMFANKLGAYAEIGYGVSPLQFGLTAIF